MFSLNLKFQIPRIKVISNFAAVLMLYTIIKRQVKISNFVGKLLL